MTIKTTAIGIFCFALMSCNSNVDPTEEFLLDFLSDRGLSAKEQFHCIRTDRSYPMLEDMMTAIYAADTLKEMKSGNFIVLTADERKKIAQGLTEDNAGCRALASLKGVNVLMMNSVNVEKLSDKTTVYRFSKPIFIRDNKVCIFFFSYGCGDLCGGGNLSVYKKSWFGWKPFLTLYDWIA